jgi:hypothetical protein
MNNRHFAKCTLSDSPTEEEVGFVHNSLEQ